MSANKSPIWAHWVLVIATTSLLVLTSVATVVRPVAAQEELPPGGFCENRDGYVVNDQQPWPQSDPCGGASTFEVVSCQYRVGQFDPAGFVRKFATYEAARTKCITGIVWAKPDLSKLELGICAKLATREERLDCATAMYFAYGEKLAGIQAYMRSLGATWAEIRVGDPFQPSADALPDGSPRIWGAVLKARGLQVTGFSCLVTDTPARIANYGWVYMDDSYSPHPSVGHYGEAQTVGHIEEIAFHGDCSDWPEIRAAMGIEQPAPEAEQPAQSFWQRILDFFRRAWGWIVGIVGIVAAVVITLPTCCCSICCPPVLVLTAYLITAWYLSLWPFRHATQPGP